MSIIAVRPPLTRRQDKALTDHLERLARAGWMVARIDDRSFPFDAVAFSNSRDQSPIFLVAHGTSSPLEHRVLAERFGASALIV